MKTAPEQTTLFDLTLPGTELPVAQRKITTGCLLPLAANQVIDCNRVCSILAVSATTIYKLLGAGKLSGYKVAPYSPWMIHYHSIVAYCDELRLSFGIADRRPKLGLGKRWRDCDLLPFPASDTITVKDVMKGLDTNKTAALGLIDDGSLEAYRLLPYAPWRISKTSLFAYAERLKAQLNAGTSSAAVAAFRRPQ